MVNTDAFQKEWEFNQLGKIDPNAILIEGLPGMGNVGKITADFIVDQTKAKKVLEIHSHNFPHCVFVNEKNQIDLPIIELYQKKIKNQNLLFLVGDIQPLDEKSCYQFCNLLLDFSKKNKVKEIITLGGIGHREIPEKPKVYLTGTDEKIIKKYSSKDTNNKIHGVVGPIVGVTGLLLGIASKRKVPAVTLLAETFSHPNYLGIKGSRQIIKVLDNKFNLKLDLKKLDSEIKTIEKEIKKKITKVSNKSEDLSIDYIG